jgi:maltose-binding protein MalE
MSRRSVLQYLLLSALIVGSLFQGELSLARTSLPEESGPPMLPAHVTEETTISLWHSYLGYEATVLNDVITAFETSHPTVQVSSEYVPFDDLYDTFVTAMGQGQGPALLIGASDWGAQLYDDGWIADLSSLASAEFLATIHPVALSAVQYKGALIGLPHTEKGVILYRNTSIIPDAVATYPELVTAAQSATQGDVVGADLERGFFFSAAHLHGMGGRLMNRYGCPAFNNQTGVDWLNLLVSFEDAGPTEYHTDNDLNLFQDGKVGFIIDGTWNMANISDTLGIDNVAIDPWPAPLSGYVQVENIYLAADLTDPEQADGWAFMEYLLSVEAQEIMLDAGHIPAVSGVPIADPLMQQAADALAGGTAFPVIPQILAYWGPMDTALLSVFEGSAEPAQALQGAYDDIVAALLALGYSCGHYTYLPLVTR